MQSKLTVISGVYKTEQYLRQCLDSIVNQTYQNLELILIDDGSPDNGGLICDEYARKDNRVVVIHKENEGVYAGWNDGIKRATGDWITFIDSDDWLELDYYEQLLKALDEKDVDVFCAGGVIFEYAENSRILRTFPHSFQLEGEDVKRLKAEVCSNCKHRGGVKNVRMSGRVLDKLYKTAFLRKEGLYFEASDKIQGDFWFNFRVFDKAMSVSTCTYIGYHYRQAIYKTSYMRGYHEERIYEGYDIIKKLYEYCECQGEAMMDAIESLSLGMFVNALNAYYFHPANPKTYKEISEEIKNVKKWPYFHMAIYSKNNTYLSNKQIVLKYVLRLPWIWPLKLLWAGDRNLKK